MVLVCIGSIIFGFFFIFLLSNYGMKNIKKTLNESGLAVYEELAANHVDPMECYSLGWKFKSECFHNMTRDLMFKKGTVVFLFLE